jgi:outer membrane protein
MRACQRWRVAAIVIVLSSLLGFSLQVMAQQQTLYVRAMRANVRDSPAIASENILGVLSRGTPVIVFEPKGDWYPVQLEDGRSGWMHASVLSAEQPPPATTGPVPPVSRLPLVRIGIIQDAPALDQFVAVFEQEIRHLLSNEYTVQFPDAMRLKADWTVARVRAALDRLLANPRVDLILALGPIAAQEAGHRGALSKPLFAPFVLDATLQGMPQKDGASGVRNLSYYATPVDLVGELRTFLSIVRFKKLALLVVQGLVESLPEIDTLVRREIAELDLEATIVPVGTTADTTLAALPADIQAVYVSAQPQLASEEFTKLVNGLIARRLPSFASQRHDVERGLMASLQRDTDFPRLARRVALNVQRALQGDDPGTFPVTFTRGERLTLNMATVRALGVSPPWDLLTQADLLHADDMAVRRTLSLASAVEEAVNANLDLQAVGRFVAAGAENISEARSALLPQIDVTADARMVDADRAEGSNGAFPERQITGGLNLFQLIYDEPTWANLSIQRDLQSAREEERNITLLDVVLEATVNYLNVLSAKTIENIQRQNLDLTRSNLELAQLRRQIGVARAAEVVRWENQIATNRSTVINAFSQRQQAEIALNRVLHRPLEEKFQTEEPALDNPVLITNFAKVFPYVSNPRYFEIFRDFMVEAGLEAAPELRLADAQIRAQERSLLSEQRSFYTPTFSLRAGVVGVGRGGAGSEPTQIPIGGGNIVEFPFPDNLDWEVGVTGSLPLYAGGSRVARRNQAQETLAQLRVEREAAAERVATRIRTALYQAGASFANIDLSREAARAARRNYELVLDGYRQGVVSILDQLDAQTQALNADLDAANAVYIYLSNLMQVQRAVGQFDFFVSASGRQAWFEKLDAFFRASGVKLPAKEKSEGGAIEPKR